LVVAALLSSLLSRLRHLFPQRSVMLLIGGSALAMLLGTVTGNGFEFRFLIPQVPLLITSGALGLQALLDLVTNHRRGAGSIHA
jgi:hypothetical protein